MRICVRIRLDGGKEDAVMVDQLQRSIINERSLSASLNVRQVGALCSYLAQVDRCVLCRICSQCSYLALVDILIRQCPSTFTKVQSQYILKS